MKRPEAAELFSGTGKRQTRTTPVQCMEDQESRNSDSTKQQQRRLTYEYDYRKHRR